MLAACGAGSAEPEPTAQEKDSETSSTTADRGASSPQLDLDFDDLGPDDLTPDSVLRIAGSFEMRVRTVSGGRITLETDPSGGQAVRLPAHQLGAKTRAVIAVVASDPSLLGPGPDDFELAVSFNLDAESEGGLDNGNNLVQRGLWGRDAQYKIQVDDGIVSCRVAGDRGEVIVKATKPVAPGVWFTARCVRSQDGLKLRLGGPDGASAVSEAEGPTGDLTFRDETPLVIGGKTTPEGVPVEGASDQFNGAVDDVALLVHR